jgi:hypothetical protein
MFTLEMAEQMIRLESHRHMEDARGFDGLISLRYPVQFPSFHWQRRSLRLRAGDEETGDAHIVDSTSNIGPISILSSLNSMCRLRVRTILG